MAKEQTEKFQGSEKFEEVQDDAQEEKKEIKIDKAAVIIRKAVESGKAIIGTKKSLEAIKAGKVATVYVTTNCPEDVLADVDYYGKLSSFKVIKLVQDNVELGVICKKPFSISVLAVQA